MADSPRPMRIRLPTCRPMPAPATAPGAAPTPKANAPATTLIALWNLRMARKQLMGMGELRA
ncbi:hypothetical protein C206_19406 [Pseudomonas putida TRO1]|uniref:Uncharacterized protein n=1 Tax=Pseudomonas putida TRO1 TaxID=1227924 RepID=A0AAD2ZRS8_PSEPU|nr:hypothetical protein KKK_13255 [Pseudomonas putida B6-2]ENY75842.1 hypothetical protein C206_19406 [Pseudomonas putida TRO1]OAK61112.1 hypothetical protein A3K88_16865 [Pseudomonas putida]TRO30492.1 hypothetical protein EQ845_26100 [Pseudomonas putida]